MLSNATQKKVIGRTHPDRHMPLPYFFWVAKEAVEECVRSQIILLGCIQYFHLYNIQIHQLVIFLFQAWWLNMYLLIMALWVSWVSLRRVWGLMNLSWLTLCWPHIYPVALFRSVICLITFPSFKQVVGFRLVPNNRPPFHMRSHLWTVWLRLLK